MKFNGELAVVIFPDLYRIPHQLSAILIVYTELLIVRQLVLLFLFIDTWELFANRLIAISL